MECLLQGPLLVSISSIIIHSCMGHVQCSLDSYIVGFAQRKIPVSLWLHVNMQSCDVCDLPGA